MELSDGVAINQTGNDQALILDSRGDNPDLLGGARSFDISLNVNSTDSGTQTALLSYANPDNNNEVLVYNDANGKLSLYINGQSVSSNINAADIFDGENHDFRVSWDNDDGSVTFYLDGQEAGTATLAQGYTIGEDGVLMLGQEQDSVGGNLDGNQTFRGEYHDVSITTVGDMGTNQAHWDMNSIEGGVITDLAGDFDLSIAEDLSVSPKVHNTMPVGLATKVEVDGETVYDGEYGTLTINPDGSYSYELDDSNPTVEALNDGDTLTENFDINIIEDQSGVVGTSALSITINGTTDNIIITGTKGDDTLIGTELNETIYGLGGKDTIEAGGGDDFIDGGKKKDIIDAGEGDDEIMFDGKDYVDGGEGIDTLILEENYKVLDFNKLHDEQIENIEVIDLRQGEHTLKNLDISDVLNMTEEDNNILKILGNSDDEIKMNIGEDDWIKSDTKVEDDNYTFDVWTHNNNNTLLYIDENIIVTDI